MRAIHSDVRMLIAVRVVVVSTLLLAALIIQFTVNIILPIDYLYLTTGLTYALTLLYIAVGKWLGSRTLNLYVQFVGDLFVETVLVYFTGGLDSPFSFLYLVSIITASMMLYRRGGLIIASASVILYGALADLMYYEFLPRPTQNLFSPTSWTSMRLYLNMATNFAGFYATALLTSYISEKLRKTFEELDANRRNLEQLKALNQNVVQSIPSGLITVNPYGTIAFVNPAGADILQRPADELVGRHLTETGLFSDEQWNHLKSAMQTNRIIRGEKNDYVCDGATRSLGYALTPLHTLDGSYYGMTLIFQDLTEVKKLESQLRLKDRMAAVGELSAGIAHEIRNPLAAIAGSVQVLKTSKNLAPQEQRLMSIILKESDRLNKSIADFLRFVKPHEKLAAEFDIAASLAETLDLLANSPELASSHIIERAIEPASFSVVGDPDQIRQVFWNVAKNAIQAMPDGGILHVATDVDGEAYRIIFSDSGKGMSEQDVSLLFQPFRTGFPSGTGLGMAISYRIVQEHGGRIDVDSRVGSGTTITISLPLSLQKRLAAAAASVAV